MGEENVNVLQYVCIPKYSVNLKVEQVRITVKYLTYII